MLQHSTFYLMIVVCCVDRLNPQVIAAQEANTLHDGYTPRADIGLDPGESLLLTHSGQWVRLFGGTD
jgi:hypothetical protein